MREAWEIKRLVYACSRASSNFSQNNLSNNEGMYPIFGASGLIKNVSFYTPDKPYLSISKNGCMPFLVSHSKINGCIPNCRTLCGSLKSIF